MNTRNVLHHTLTLILLVTVAPPWATIQSRPLVVDAASTHATSADSVDVDLRDTAGQPMHITTDTVPPSTVANLTASTGTLAGTVDLSWIAPGDDDSAGTASVYIVRYNTTIITDSNWITSTDVTGEPTPSPAGSVERMTVSGLTPGQVYHFAMKTQDEVANASGVSNSPGAAAKTGPFSVYLPQVALSASELLPVIPDTTHVLTQTTTQYLSSISGDGAVFTFTQSTPALSALAPGEVIVGDVTADTPYGFLRKVTSVSPVGGQVVVATTQATLEDAIETGAAQISHVLTPDQIEGGMLADGVTLAAAPQSPSEFYITLDNVVLYDNGYGGKIRANGSIRLNLDFGISLKVRRWRLEEFAFIPSATETADLTIESGIALSRKLEKEIARHKFRPITVWIGAVPVVVVPVLTVNVGVDGSVHAGVTAGVRQEAKMWAGLRYADGHWNPDYGFSNQFYFDPPTLSAGLDLKGYAGAQLSLMLYGVTGPYAKLNAYLRLEADIADDPWWSLYAGLEVPVGVKIEVLGHLVAGYEITLIDYRLKLLQAQPNARPKVPSNPSPADNAINQNLNAQLSWIGGDPDGDAVTYDVYFEAGDDTPDVRVSHDQAGIAYDPGTLSAGSHYYWRIVAKDEHGATNPGPVWDFTVANHPPYTPSNPDPSNGSDGVPYYWPLGWTGGDPDGDFVTYDVYLEAGHSPPDVLACQHVTSDECYILGYLNLSTLYYWQVIATDSHGETTRGPVWNFTTY